MILKMNKLLGNWQLQVDSTVSVVSTEPDIKRKAKYLFKLLFKTPVSAPLVHIAHPCYFVMKRMVWAELLVATMYQVKFLLWWSFNLSILDSDVWCVYWLSLINCLTGDFLDRIGCFTVLNIWFQAIEMALHGKLKTHKGGLCKKYGIKKVCNNYINWASIRYLCLQEHYV